MTEKTDKTLKTPSNLSEAIGYLENLIKSHGNKKISVSDHKEHIQNIIVILEDIKTSPDDNDTEKDELQALYAQKEADLKVLNDENKQLKAETTQKSDEIKRLRDEILKIKAQKYDEILGKKHDTNPILKKQPTFADIARINNPMANNNAIQRKNHVVIISPKDEDVSKDSNQTIAFVKEKINAKTTLENGLRIERLQPVSGKKCLIKCNSEKDVEKICNILNNDDKITAKKPTKKNPRIMVVGISKDIEKEQIPTLIKAQNPKINEFIENNENENMKILFDKEDRVGSKYAIIEASPALWKLILDENRLFIGYKSCPVRNRVSVFQCFKCQKFGHSGNDCKNDTKCVNCAGDHETKNCKSTIHKCINCDRTNTTKHQDSRRTTEMLDINHRANNIMCPQYQKEIAIATRYYNYG
ncbi:uncharacterized protein LOC142646240 [Dermatophagoides pteronyssinus]|uniref:uncharacterized protein LOC142646240 n=1 Tax=Dermatophagoides pteronyssinus TaxID=6956 RepID=UPI003F6647FF